MGTSTRLPCLLTLADQKQKTFALLLAALLMVPIAPVPIVSVACVALCAGGLLMGLVLSQYTDSLSKFSSVDAVRLLYVFLQFTPSNRKATTSVRLPQIAENAIRLCSHRHRLQYPESFLDVVCQHLCSPVLASALPLRQPLRGGLRRRRCRVRGVRNPEDIVASRPP